MSKVPAFPKIDDTFLNVPFFELKNGIFQKRQLRPMLIFLTQTFGYREARKANEKHFRTKYRVNNRKQYYEFGMYTYFLRENKRIISIRGRSFPNIKHQLLLSQSQSQNGASCKKVRKNNWTEENIFLNQMELYIILY